MGLGKKKNRNRTSMLQDLYRRMLKSPGSKLGLIIMVLILLFCIAGPVLVPYGYNDMDLAATYAGPSAQHWMGTDSLGRDLMTRLMYGGRYSLAIGVLASLAAAVIAIILGSIAGYFGGAAETAIMRVMDIWSALPAMLLCILVSAVLGPGFFTTILALTIGNIPGGVRMIRGQILAERSREYIEAAESINCSKVSIMFRHLLPNVVQPMIVQTTMGIGNVMILAASLSYIGLGVQPPTPEWGAMLSDARAYLRTFPYLLAVPGIAIALTVFAINLLGDGLRDALDPKLRD